MNENPCIRLLEAIPVESEGQSLVVLRDPYRFVAESLTVSTPVYVLLMLMDGTRNLAEIQNQFRARFGGRISAVELEKLVEELDENHLLEGPRFEELRRGVLAEFEASTVRPAAHAGSAYEKDPDALNAQLDAFYADIRNPNGVWQASRLPGAQTDPSHADIRDSRPDDATDAASSTVLGLIAPHIDPRVGGPCAAHAFATLRNSTPPPNLFVILGTAHQPSNSMHILTEKSFETPLGRVEVDRSVAKALRDACPINLLRDEYLHKHEHSIEFQLIFLQRLYQGGTGVSPVALSDRHDARPTLGPRFQILPILVGSFHEFIETNTLPLSCGPVRDFTEALSAALKASGKRVCVVAGADLSHMGRKFGDEEDLSDAFIESSRAWDRQMLAHLEAGDSEAFFRFVQEDGDKQKVCGLPPIYTMLSLLGDGCKGTLLGYDLSVEEQTQTFVSFASMAFRR